MRIPHLQHVTLAFSEKLSVCIAFMIDVNDMEPSRSLSGNVAMDTASRGKESRHGSTDGYRL